MNEIPGSSPRVRGTSIKPDFWRDEGRFIPACAGNILIRNLLILIPNCKERKRYQKK